MVFCFVLNFFFVQHELEYFFLSRQARNFFPEFHIRLYDKNSESDYFFFASTKIRIFFSASLGIRVKWSFPNTSQYTTIHYGFFKSQYWYNTGKKNYTSIVHNTSIPVLWSPSTGDPNKTLNARLLARVITGCNYM